jgi:predicted DNA-binding transcriptional regulator AlpA
MKTIDMGRGVQVSTPILSAEEAAVYLGVSLRAFWRLGAPRHNVGGSPRWHCRELDEWVKKEGGSRNAEVGSRKAEGGIGKRIGYDEIDHARILKNEMQVTTKGKKV